MSVDSSAYPLPLSGGESCAFIGVQGEFWGGGDLYDQDGADDQQYGGKS